jgi:hypothetical protein
VNLKTLRQRCERLLREVEVPDPFEVHAFAEAVSCRRGRPLHLVAKSSPLGPCGMWLALPAADLVFYEVTTSRLHREHIIVHELAHILAAHEPTEPVDVAALATLLPDLDPSMVRQVLARSTYSAVDEQEAEMLASLILTRGSAGARNRVRTSETNDPGDSDTGVLDRLQATLGGPRPGPHGR